MNIINMLFKVLLPTTAISAVASPFWSTAFMVCVWGLIALGVVLFVGMNMNFNAIQRQLDEKERKLRNY